GRARSPRRPCPRTSGSRRTWGTSWWTSTSRCCPPRPRSTPGCPPRRSRPSGGRTTASPRPW
ncbi:unnamed protein product, partial [Heterosigma akashiwo]